MKDLYTAEAHSTGDGRNGHVRTVDGAVDLDLTAPPELGGPGTGANPEQLFAAGYAACIHQALRLVAQRAGHEVPKSAVTTRVSLGLDSTGGYALAVEIALHIPGVGREDAERLAEQANEACPYSKATRGNIPVSVTVADD